MLLEYPESRALRTDRLMGTTSISPIVAAAVLFEIGR
jgi:hypothetical protein